MSWETTGNAGTDPASNFLGTADNQPLVIKTNNTEALRVDTGGKVGVGTESPGARLEIVGNWDGNEGAVRLTGDRPTIRFAGGAPANNANWILQLGSRGPGNLAFMHQTAPSVFDAVMTFSRSGNPLDPAAEIVGNWNGQEGALRITGDKPTIKFAGGGDAGNATWVLHLGSRGPGNLSFMKQTAPGVFDAVMTFSRSGNPLDPAAEIVGDWNGQEGALRLTGDRPTLKFAGGAPTTNTTWIVQVGSRGPGNLEFMRQTAPGAFTSMLALTTSGNVGVGTSLPAAKLHVEGAVVVTGDISLANADCAEDFEIAAGCSAEPGTVMVLDDESSLRDSFQAYDKRVAGVISGAGSYQPGIVLDRHKGQGNRKPVALVGKVFCKADARFGSIAVGDLLTTSPTPGYAMRADDPLKAFGAVIGKALRPLAGGQALIPILITLQ
jgi:hypothetical protein